MSSMPCRIADTGTDSVATYPYTATISPSPICPEAAMRAADQITTATKTVGSASATAPIQLVTAATRYPSSRNVADRVRYRSANTSLPPIPHSTRRPVTISPTMAVNSPCCAR